MITPEKIKIASELLQKIVEEENNSWEGKEGKWAILLTEEEIGLMHKCMLNRFFPYVLKKRVSFENMCKLTKIIKSLGEIA